MELIKISYLDIGKFTLEDNEIVAIGKFDGIHLGHHTLIDKLIEIGNELNMKKAILTFSPTPEEFFNKGYRGVLMGLNEKMNYLKKMGIDYLYVLKFDEHIVKMKPEAFFSTFLKPFWGVVCGKDFRFGHNSEGDSLKLLEYNPHTFIVPKFKIDGVRVSSDLIKTELQKGNIMEANKLLAKRFTLKGKVVTGMGLGKKLGIPTANLLLKENYAELKHGVYICFAKIDHNSYYGLMNYGVAPTFTDGSEVKVEIHFLDYVGDIYKKELDVELVDFLREEEKFTSEEAFKQQLIKDLDEARKRWK